MVFAVPFFRRCLFFAVFFEHHNNEINLFSGRIKSLMENGQLINVLVCSLWATEDGGWKGN
jgi:hypothetical protein